MICKDKFKFLFLLLILIVTFISCAEDEPMEIVFGHTTEEISDENYYDLRYDVFKGNHKTFDTLEVCNENIQIGNIKIYGEINQKTVNGYQAFAITGNKVFFTYDQTFTNDDKYEMIYENYGEVSGNKIGHIGYGGFLIERSYDLGQTWEYFNLSYTNVKDNTIKFYPEGDDINKGVLYKFTSVITFEEVISIEEKSFLFFDWTKDTKEEYKLKQISYAYLATDNVEIGFYAGAYSNKTYELSYNLYKQNGNGQIVEDDKTKVDSLFSNCNRLGLFEINGQLNKTNWNGYETYLHEGASDITISFKTEFDNVFDDELMSIHYFDENEFYKNQLSDSIGTGKLLIFKSTNNEKDYVLDNEIPYNGDSLLTYTANPIDYINGCIYKIYYVVCFSEEYFRESTGMLWWKETTVLYNYYTCIQESTIYLLENREEISNDRDLETGLEVMIELGSVMTDGSASFSTIGVNIFNNETISVKCSYNFGKYKDVEDKTVFTKHGRYDFEVETSFGTKKKTTLYIFDLGDDNGYSHLFGESFISEEMRIYNTDSSLPQYMVGSEFKTLGSELMPSVKADIFKLDENNELEKILEFDYSQNGFQGKFVETGTYVADIYMGSLEKTGQFIEYVFTFEICDEGNKPFVNEELLKKDYRSSSYSCKVYTVKYPTNSGGSYIYVFPYDGYYYEALDLAEKIELEKVRIINDGLEIIYNYLGKNYYKKLDLYKVLYDNVKKNVNIEYINHLELKTKSHEQVISETERISIVYDEYVICSEEIRKDLLVEDVILNNFEFYQLAKYESSSVYLINENGDKIDVPYGVNLSTILTESGRYEIHEQNWYGENVYYAYYNGQLMTKFIME